MYLVKVSTISDYIYGVKPPHSLREYFIAVINVLYQHLYCVLEATVFSLCHVNLYVLLLLLLPKIWNRKKKLHNFSVNKCALLRMWYVIPYCYTIFYCCCIRAMVYMRLRNWVMYCLFNSDLKCCSFTIFQAKWRLSVWRSSANRRQIYCRC